MPRRNVINVNHMRSLGRPLPYFICMAVYYSVLFGLMPFFFGDSGLIETPVDYYLPAIITLAVTHLAMWAVLILRLKDSGRSLFLSLLFFVPLVGQVALLEAYLWPENDNGS